MFPGAQRRGKAGITMIQWKLHDVERDRALGRERYSGKKGCGTLGSCNVIRGSCDVQRKRPYD